MKSFYIIKVFKPNSNARITHSCHFTELSYHTVAKRFYSYKKVYRLLTFNGNHGAAEYIFESKYDAYNAKKFLIKLYNKSNKKLLNNIELMPKISISKYNKNVDHTFDKDAFYRLCREDYRNLKCRIKRIKLRNT